MPTEIVLDKVAFESPDDRGFTVKAWYLVEPKGDALIEIRRAGDPYRRFMYPAYKIWNIAAHFGDIVTSEIAGDSVGYDMAGWDGLFSIVEPIQIAEPEASDGR